MPKDGSKWDELARKLEGAKVTTPVAKLQPSLPSRRDRLR